MITRKTLAAFAAAASLAVAGCGDDDPSSTAADGNSTDRAFVAEMVPHHQGALDMAKIARQRGQSPFVRTLAEDIVRTQTEEISELRKQDRELADAGVEKGMLGGGHSSMGMEDAASLKTAEPFDRAFLEMMVPHHQSAVEMAKTELAEGKDPELKQLAQDIIDAQEREMRAMREQL